MHDMKHFTNMFFDGNVGNINKTKVDGASDLDRAPFLSKLSE